MALIEFQNNSAPYLNADNLNNNFNYLDEKNDYSTEEKIIGKWINGKPIYRKVITSYGNTGTSVAILHNIENLETVTNLNVIATQNNGVTYPSNNDLFTLKINKVFETYLDLNINSNYSNWYINITIEYTKSTDEGDE